MATVSKRGNVYTVRYRYETDTGEIRQKRVSGFKTEADAWAKAKELEALSEAGVDVTGGNMTCEELMEKWFAERRNTWEPTTMAKYSNAIDKISKSFISKIKVKKMNSKYYNTLIEQLMETVSARTAISNTEPLRLAFSWAWQEKMIPVNPLFNIKQPKQAKSEQKILSDDDIQDLVKASSSNRRKSFAFRTPMLLAIYGGLRREECAGLRWEDIDFKNKSITITQAIAMTPDGKEHLKEPKTTLSKRTISMPKWIMDELAARYQDFLKLSNEEIKERNPMHRVCAISAGTPLSCQSYSHAIIRLIREVNKERESKKMPRIPEASFHDLRHTHAALCIRLGIQPKVIQERLGHASIKITMDLYGYLMPGMQQTVADALDRDYNSRNTQ